MRYLLDTNVLLWALEGNQALSSSLRNLLNESRNECYVSDISLWEATIKFTIGKLEMDDGFFDAPEACGYIPLPLKLDHIKAFKQLPLHHRDPFDRILVAQAMVENLTIITSDKILKQYDAKIILA